MGRESARLDAVSLRPLRAEDGESAGEIFWAAVHQGAAGHYSPEERRAWAGAAPNPSAWRDRLRGVEGFMAELDGAPVGFMTLDTAGDLAGHIDLAFVSPRVKGMGVGWRLYRAVEQRARQLGLACLTTEASKAAKPFFERQGWEVEREQVVVRREVPLVNFRMSKPLKD